MNLIKILISCILILLPIVVIGVTGAKDTRDKQYNLNTNTEISGQSFINIIKTDFDMTFAEEQCIKQCIGRK